VQMVPDCDALIALSLGGNAVWLDSAPQTPLLRLQRQHMLLESADELTSGMLTSCLAQTGFGVSGATFDFVSMESDLASRLLTGARHVDLNADEMGDRGVMAKVAPSIFVFKGELLPRQRMDRMRRICELMTQDPVSNARSLRAEPFLAEPKNCRETLELLEIVLYTATKSLPSPDEHLDSYCATFNVAGTEDSLRKRVLQCASIGKVPLKQLRSLYDLVEDIVADAVLPNLPGHFRASLPSTSVVDRACLELGRRTISAGAGDAVGQAAAMRAGRLRLEPALKRFIYRELKESAIFTDAQLDAALYHRVWDPDFPWTIGDECTDEEVEAAFDDETKETWQGVPALKHAYAFWNELKKRGGGLGGDVDDWVMV